MYILHQKTNDLFELHSSNPGKLLVIGTQLYVLKYATRILDFEPNELEAALLAMIRENKDSAHFGINKTFMWPFNHNEKVG